MRLFESQAAILMSSDQSPRQAIVCRCCQRTTDANCDRLSAMQMTNRRRYPPPTSDSALRRRRGSPEAFTIVEVYVPAGAVTISASPRRDGPPATIWTTPAMNPISVPICQAWS